MLIEQFNKIVIIIPKNTFIAIHLQQTHIWPLYVRMFAVKTVEVIQCFTKCLSAKS